MLMHQPNVPQTNVEAFLFVLMSVNQGVRNNKNIKCSACIMFQLVLPEYFLHMLYTVLFLFAFQLGSLIWNLPLAVYHVRRFVALIEFAVFLHLAGSCVKESL